MEGLLPLQNPNLPKKKRKRKNEKKTTEPRTPRRETEANPNSQTSFKFFSGEGERRGRGGYRNPKLVWWLGVVREVGGEGKEREEGGGRTSSKRRSSKEEWENMAA